MGYTTDFNGEFEVRRDGKEATLTEHQFETLAELNAERHEGAGYPGYWCGWKPDAGYYGTTIVWDGMEKFYGSVEWLEYLCATYLTPWGYQLDGDVEWSGEEWADVGLIRCTPIKGGGTEIQVLEPTGTWEVTSTVTA